MSFCLQFSTEHISSLVNTMYTTGNHSSGNVPLHSLKPVSYSITERTSAPLASVQQHAEYTPPQTPTSEKDTAQVTFRQSPASNYYGGPLSSNPVTPVDSNDLPRVVGDSRRGSAFFGMSRPGTAYQHTYATKGFAQPSVNSISTPPYNNPNARDRYYHTNGIGISNGNNPTPPPSSKQPRLPSLARRFLRSLSSTHSLSGKYKKPSSTTSSLSQSQQRHDGNGTIYYHIPDSSARGSLREAGRASNSARGAKRPASRSSIGPECALANYAEIDVGGGSSGSGNSFPRMVRKKSMEWFGSAKRKSGIWGGGDVSVAAVEEEERLREKDRERERAREEDMEAQMAMEEKRKRETLMMEPPPVLPELDRGFDGGSLGGGQIFEEIGR